MRPVNIAIGLGVLWLLMRPKPVLAQLEADPHQAEPGADELAAVTAAIEAAGRARIEGNSAYVETVAAVDAAIRAHVGPNGSIAAALVDNGHTAENVAAALAQIQSAVGATVELSRYAAEELAAFTHEPETAAPQLVNPTEPAEQLDFNQFDSYDWRIRRGNYIEP